MYFLLIALTPLSSVLAYYYFKIIPFSLYVISSAAIIMSLQYYKDKKIWFGVVLLILMIPLTFYLNEPKFDLFINIILRCIIIAYFIYYLLGFMYLKKAVNFYFITLIIYEVSLVLKMLTVLINIQTGRIDYYLTSIFELIICIYFIFFNIKNSPQFKLPEK
jgi:hypothetical protein